MFSLYVAMMLACTGEPVRTPEAVGSHTTANFRIQQVADEHAIVNVEFANKCESTLRSLRQDWFCMELKAWQPQCDLVLHTSRESYQRAAGTDSRSTVGSARVRVVGGEVVQRRIDLLATTPEETFHSLQHELVHLLFAEKFPDRPPPRWAEEGLALLADTAEKQGRHKRDLEYAVDNNQLIPLPSLLSASEYPRGWQRAIFYGQSLTLVEHLVERESPRTFVQFLGLVDELGYDPALQEVYKVPNVTTLRQAWLASLEPH